MAGIEKTGSVVTDLLAPAYAGLDAAIGKVGIILTSEMIEVARIKGGDAFADQVTLAAISGDGLPSVVAGRLLEDRYPESMYLVMQRLADHGEQMRQAEEEKHGWLGLRRLGRAMVRGFSGNEVPIKDNSELF